MDRPAPVSYTHLDVYKRQECHRLAGRAGGNYLLVDTTTGRVGDEIGTEGTLWPSHIWPVKIRKTDADLVAEAYDRWLGKD